MKQYGEHYSVMLRDCDALIEEHLGHLGEISGMDGTFGGGGHSLYLAKKYKNLNLTSFDQDPEAISNGNKLIGELELGSNVNLIHDNFENFDKHIQKNSLNFILLDLGVSSHHFDDQTRGFSFRFDSDLDMRMDKGELGNVSAADIVNKYTEQELEEILLKYGEERFARRIAQQIVATRKIKYIERTKELEDIVFHCYPKKMRFGKIHPATKTFQAIRIEANRELEVLENTLLKCYEYLNDECSLLMVISFHSLEDRITKHFMKNISQSNATHCKMVSKKPILPSQQEVEENSRSRSAKLRVLKKAPVPTRRWNEKKEKI